MQTSKTPQQLLPQELPLSQILRLYGKQFSDEQLFSDYFAFIEKSWY
jgi:hypothetical protein